MQVSLANPDAFQFLLSCSGRVTVDMYELRASDSRKPGTSGASRWSSYLGGFPK